MIRLIVSTIALFCVLDNVQAASKYAGTKPNMVMIFIDDLGYGDMSVTGHPTIHTPNIDKLAAEGMRLTTWYSAFHVCSPSRGSLMTGRLPPRWGGAGGRFTGGVFNSVAEGGLPLNETTIAEHLKTVGYRTAMAGKWHLGQREMYLPANRGFDESFTIPYSVDMGSSAWSAGGWPPLPLLNGTTVIEQPANLDTIVDRYISFADEFIQKSAKDGAPFFLYLPFSHMHVPDFASQKFCNTSIRGRFGDGMNSVDNYVGAVMASLKSAGVDDSTLVLFSSDNGPWLVKRLSGGSAALFRDGKETTWEGGIREPGFVRWPNHVPAGTISPELVTTYDVFSTALALAGVPEPTDRIIDGKDMSPVIFDNGKTSHDCIFIYKGTPNLNCADGNKTCPGLWATRCGSYKIHWVTSNWTSNPNDPQYHDPPIIYNVDADPSESWQLDPESDEYKAQRPILEAAAAKHKAGLKYAKPQMVDSGKQYAVCGDPESQKKYPQFPNCTMNPENYKVFVCAPLGPVLEELDADEFDSFVQSLGQGDVEPGLQDA